MPTTARLGENAMLLDSLRKAPERCIQALVGSDNYFRQAILPFLPKSDLPSLVMFRDMIKAS
jgi:hypothetical protein